MGEREGEKEKWKENVVFLFFYCVCVCIKNGKGPVGGMLGLGQRDGVAYKRITPNIRQNKRTFFVFTSFSLFSSLAVLLLLFLHYFILALCNLSLSLSLLLLPLISQRLWLVRNKWEKNKYSICDPHSHLRRVRCKNCKVTLGNVH